MSHPIVVKWGKETVEVNLVPSGGVKGLKAELEEKTGVPQDRQKIMPKSKGEARSRLDLSVVMMCLHVMHVMFVQRVQYCRLCAVVLYDVNSYPACSVLKFVSAREILAHNACICNGIFFRPARSLIQ